MMRNLVALMQRATAHLPSDQLDAFAGEIEAMLQRRMVIHTAAVASPAFNFAEAMKIGQEIGFPLLLSGGSSSEVQTPPDEIISVERLSAVAQMLFERGHTVLLLRTPVAGLSEAPEDATMEDGVRALVRHLNDTGESVFTLATSDSAGTSFEVTIKRLDPPVVQLDPAVNEPESADESKPAQTVSEDLDPITGAPVNGIADEVAGTGEVHEKPEPAKEKPEKNKEKPKKPEKTEKNK